MIKAGNHTISDKGFTVVTENIGGAPRQAVVAELPGGISDEALAAFCAGPIEVLAEDGSTTATYTGPFRVVSHGLKLTRTSEDSDVAALTAQVAELEAKLSHEKSEKESAQSALARLNEQLTTLKMTLEANSADKAVVDEAPSADKAVVDKVPVEAMDAAGIPAARPGPDERRTKRYGTVTFQSGKRQPGEAGGKQQAHQVHQAGQ